MRARLVDENMTLSGRERVAQDAADRGIRIEFVERTEPVASLDEAAAALGVEPRNIVKSLVVKKSDDTFVFVLVPGDRQIAWPKLRAVLGVNKVQLPSPDAALAATGYERGTITPLGSTTAWPVVADERIVGQKIWMGGGEHGLSATVDGNELIAAFGATVADVTEAR